MSGASAAAPGGLEAMVAAAGGSSRYGCCKQLVEIGGVSLVRRAVQRLLALFPAERIRLVVGADAAAVAAQVQDLAVNAVHNERWRDGMATSLQAGISSAAPGCRAVLVTLCDQALVTEHHLRQLLNLWAEDESRIAAAAYGGGLGAPAIIPVGFFPQIMALDGDEGAKSILVRRAGQAAALPLAAAEFDLDAPADLERLAALSAPVD